jgi:hypothetical protein
MIINKFIVVYYLFLFFSLTVGILAAGSGLQILTKWHSTMEPESRVKLENKFYLCSFAMFLGACVRIVMIPLWFYMLYKLIPLLPGAMCLAGVHLAVPPYSWLASSMKLILPLLYFSWITISIVDKKILEQPFLKFRHYFLIPLILFTFIETFLDLKYLFALKPINVSCCMVLFDLHPEGAPQLLTKTHWYFVISFCLFFTLQLFLMTTFSKKKLSYLVSSICSILMFISLPLALHTKLSPIILGIPFHHCVFCLLQTNIMILAGTVVSFIAIYLSFSFGLMGYIGFDKTSFNKIALFLYKIKWVSITLYFTGFISLLIPILRALIHNGYM